VGCPDWRVGWWTKKGCDQPHRHNPTHTQHIAPFYTFVTGVLLGSLFYARDSLHLSPVGTFWLAVWFVVSLSQIMWLKHVVKSSTMSSWERSLYQNALSLPVFACLAIVARETSVPVLLDTATADWAVVGLSCAFGVGISYFGFALAAALSATLFTTIGNMCKVLTILISFAVGHDHAGVAGTCGLLVSIAAGALYEEPPLRSVPSEEKPVVSKGQLA